MDETIHLTIPPAAWKDSAPSPRRRRNVDAAGVARIAADMVRDKLEEPMRKLEASYTKMRDTEAKVAKLQEVVKARDARAEVERGMPPPSGYVRDAAGTLRQRTTHDLQRSADAAYGRPAPFPGTEAYDREFHSHMTDIGVPRVGTVDETRNGKGVTPAHLQAIADAYYGRKSPTETPTLDGASSPAGLSFPRVFPQ